MSGSHVFVLAIIAMAFGFSLLKAWIRKQPEPPQAEEEDPVTMLSRIEALEARIQVLERIVTDRNHDLKREIDQL